MPQSHHLYFAIPGDLNALTGGYAYDRHIIAGLRERGMKVDVLHLSGEFPFPEIATLTATAALFAALPDDALVIVDGLAFGVMDDIAAREAARLRVIALCHHPLALESGLDAKRAAAMRVSEQRALAAARSVIVTSAATARLLVQEFGVPEDKIVLALPGVTVSPIEARTRSSARTSILLTVATLTRRKGHDVLLKALAQIRDLEWTARFVGGGDFDPDWAAWLRAETQRLGLEDRVDFVGNVADPTPEFDRATLFVLPSRYEGYGMAFAEALAFGLPILGARAGAVPDLVPDDAGILVPPDDAAALAQALTRLLNDAELYQRLRQGAQRAAQTLPTWKQSVDKIALLIQQLSTRHS